MKAENKNHMPFALCYSQGKKGEKDRFVSALCSNSQKAENISQDRWDFKATGLLVKT